MPVIHTIRLLDNFRRIVQISSKPNVRSSLIADLQLSQSVCLSALCQKWTLLALWYVNLRGVDEEQSEASGNEKKPRKRNGAYNINILITEVSLEET